MKEKQVLDRSKRCKKTQANKQKFHSILNITAACLEGPCILGWLISFFWYCFDPLQTEPTQKGRASQYLSSLQNANPKECLKKGNIYLTHSLKIPELKNTCRLEDNSRRSLSSHTANLTHGHVWVMRSVGLWESEWIPRGDSSWWGWGNCSHVVQSGYSEVHLS